MKPATNTSEAKLFQSQIRFLKKAMDNLIQCSACSVLLLTTLQFRTHALKCPPKHKNIIRKVCYQGKVLSISSKFPLVKLKKLTNQEISKATQKENDVEDMELDCQVVQVEKKQMNFCNICFRSFPDETGFLQHWRSDHTKPANDVEILEVEKPVQPSIPSSR